MIRYVASVLILAAGVAWVGLGAPVIGGPGLLDPDPGSDFTVHPDRYCDLTEPACQDALATAVNEGKPTPLPDDPRVRDAVLADDLIQQLLGLALEGQDYWIRIDQWTETKHGVAGASALISFASPITFDAEVTVAEDPCFYSSTEGRVVRDHPCLLEPYEFSVQSKSFTDVLVLQVNVDPDTGQLFNMRKVG